MKKKRQNKGQMHSKITMMTTKADTQTERLPKKTGAKRKNNNNTQTKLLPKKTNARRTTMSSCIKRQDGGRGCGGGEKEQPKISFEPTAKPIMTTHF